MLDLTTRPYHQPASTSDSRHRLDLYTPIHKALRAFLSLSLIHISEPTRPY